MSFTPPEDRKDTATLLRELEQSANTATSKAIRAAMIQAATELEDWHRLALNAALQLEEASRLRVSQMDTTHRAEEVHRQIKLTVDDLARVFRDLA